MRHQAPTEIKKDLLPLRQWLLKKGTLAEALKKNAVRYLDKNTVWLGKDVEIDEGTFLYPNVFILGSSVIGKNVEIIPGTIIENSRIGDDCQIGPSALIQDSIIGDVSKIGFTAQIKRSMLGERSNAKHHCYIGDTFAGNDINFGAGSITGNYDGVTKKQTIIEDGVFIGINANLVPPIKIGREAMVAAGSTIRSDVAPFSLVIARQDAHQSESAYHKKTSSGYEQREIPQKRLEQLKNLFKHDTQALYQFLTTPDPDLNGIMPIDLLFQKNGEELFDRYLIKALNFCG